MLSIQNKKKYCYNKKRIKHVINNIIKIII